MSVTFTTPLTPEGEFSRVTIDDEQISVESFTPWWMIDNILTANREDAEAGRNKRADGYLHARIPAGVYFRWYNEWKKTDRSQPFRLYALWRSQQPEHAAFRVLYPGDRVLA